VSPYSGDAYVALDDSDVSRITQAQLPVIFQRQGGDAPEFLPKLGAKLSANAMNVCVAFDGSAGATCSCRIYEGRPSACRQFEAGSHGCREARRRLGISA